MPTMPLTRTRSLPLDGARALRAALELVSEAVGQAGVANFDHALDRLELAVSRCRAAFLAQDHHEADAALRYHDRERQKLGDDFVPLFYRKAVLLNVAARYEEAGRTLLRGASA